jgi:hypothetical protein
LGAEAFTSPKAFKATVGDVLPRVGSLRILVIPLLTSVLVTGCQHAQAGETGFGKANANSIYDKGDTILFLLSDSTYKPNLR